ncbi:MAG: ABC transporter permease [Oscillospiraceae bacterium]|nr:ABC transporter permease [Oscillospiraceae bacterium]
MIRFIIKRLLMMIPVLLGVTLVVFTIMYFTPGDPAQIILGDMATEEDRELFREEHGLNGSFVEQYINYMKRVIVEGDLGTSYTTKMSVTKEIVARFPTTFKLAGVSILIACIIGIVAGVISATRQYSVFDHVATGISLIGVSLPNFWQGMMNIIVFSVWLGWFPPSGFSTPKHWVLPAITIGTSSAANIMRMTRSSMLEVIRQDYIRTARSKGQKEGVVIRRHALRNALIPIITVVGLNFGKLLGGAVLTESIFSIAGIGKLMVDAIKAKNTPLVQGGVLFIAVVMCFVNLIVDILYAFVDPKIRSQYMAPRRTAYKGKEETNG